MTHTLEGIAALPHLGVIRAQGEEAAKFLHSQLTQDFALLPPGQARLAAFCNAKGRMLASFLAVPLAADDFALVVSRDILVPTLRRLSMFVLRTKVRLVDASDQLALRGLAGRAASALFAPGLPEPWRLVSAGGAHVAGLYPSDGQARALWVAPTGTAAPAGPILPDALWLWGEVRSGVASVSAPTVEAFVPQMLNYESVGGVNFKKGCYPGQEVVARSQYRGILKRRTYLAHCAAPLAAGTELFHGADPDQPCGLVAQAAPGPDGTGCAALVAIQTSAAEAASLHAGAPGGPRVVLEPLPYLLMTDV